jgi:hypothetical protein
MARAFRERGTCCCYSSRHLVLDVRGYFCPSKVRQFSARLKPSTFFDMERGNVCQAALLGQTAVVSESIAPIVTDTAGDIVRAQCAAKLIRRDTVVKRASQQLVGSVGFAIVAR